MTSIYFICNKAKNETKRQTNLVHVYSIFFFYFALLDTAIKIPMHINLNFEHLHNCLQYIGTKRDVKDTKGTINSDRKIK